MARGFERLYRQNVADVYRYVVAVLRSPEDAEDVTQTTFLNAYRAWERGERPRQPRNWLIAIAHNVCRQRFRQSARRPFEVAFDESEGVAETFEDDGPTAADIRRALGHLSFNQRSALVMRELEGRSYAEIADILGVTMPAVETLIFRARRALREQLEASLTCPEAELAVSRQLDGRLPRSERGALRAHLRECNECAGFARSQRAQRSAIRMLGFVPLPSSLSSLSSLFGGAGGAGGVASAGLAAKAAAVVAAGAVMAGGGYEAAKHAPWSADSIAAPARAASGSAVRGLVRGAAAVVQWTMPARAAEPEPGAAGVAPRSAVAERPSLELSGSLGAVHRALPVLYVEPDPTPAPETAPIAPVSPPAEPAPAPAPEPAAPPAAESPVEAAKEEVKAEPEPAEPVAKEEQAEPEATEAGPAETESNPSGAEQPPALPPVEEGKPAEETPAEETPAEETPVEEPPAEVTPEAEPEEQPPVEGGSGGSTAPVEQTAGS